MYIYQNYPNTRSVKVRSVTTTEYNEAGQVVKVTTVEEFEERPYANYYGQSPYGTFTVNASGSVTPPELT